MKASYVAIGAIIVCMTTLAATAQPVLDANAGCDLNKGRLTGRATNLSNNPVVCNVSCEYQVTKNGPTETFGCANKLVKAKAKDVNLCGKTAKAKAIVGKGDGSCWKL